MSAGVRAEVTAVGVAGHEVVGRGAAPPVTVTIPGDIAPTARAADVRRTALPGFMGFSCGREVERTKAHPWPERLPGRYSCDGFSWV
ncbi:hypothetical protein [Streptomyces achromogenes]|uniref:hypothetical protein n=1 Tax=Streptomyces achromogenes TaxID=67255 RepID=UPI0027D8B1FA|nr:hypothetical protein [Streptomyces achromogenes]